MNSDILASALSDPTIIDLGDGRVVTVEDLRSDSNVFICTVLYTRDGEVQAFNNPWKIVDPPIFTAAGEEDPFAAFAEIVASSGFFA